MTVSGIRRAILWLLVVVAIVLVLLRQSYVQSEAFPDRTDMPLMPSTELEVVADLPLPPGNIAVADTGEVFFTFHPEAAPDINVARLDENGQGVPFPSMEWQPGGSEPLAFNEVLSLRIDQQQRLWVLDNGKHGLSKVRLLAFDPATGELLDRYEFDRKVFALGSHANDFQVTPDGQFIIISDASVFSQAPALVVYDVENKTAWRRLHQHESVLAGPYEPVVQGRAMTLFGLFTVNPGVDGIVMDQAGEWLYFASISANDMYRIPVAALIDSTLSESEVANQVESYGAKTMTDGLAMDADNNLYLSDLEHSAIVRMTPDGELETLLKSASIRWPDGFSWGPDQMLYITCSSLHQVIGLSSEDIRAKAPYQIYRFKPAVIEREDTEAL